MMSPQTFRVSMDDRLRREAARQGRPHNRLRTLLVMERFLVRLLQAEPGVFVLKGGLALELRLARARTTRDIDLRASCAPSDVAGMLERAARQRTVPDDHLGFSVAQNEDAPAIDGVGVRYHGCRFVVASHIAGKPFGDPFGVDVAVADPLHGSVELLDGTGFFERYGMPPLRVPAYPVVTHLAEKLHAYTLPRSTPNSRVKDLVDIAILAQHSVIESAHLVEAIRLTFVFRASHPVPDRLPPAPAAWVEPYARLAREEQLTWASLEELETWARRFFNPLLAGTPGVWEPTMGTWMRSSDP